MAYLLDADIFIAAKHLRSGFDCCPVCWDWFIVAHSIDKVCDELRAEQDALAQGIDRCHNNSLYGSATVPAVQPVVQWVDQYPHHSPAAKETFLQITDYHLIMQVLADSHIVVTYERPAEPIHTVKISNVCLVSTAMT